MFPRIKSAAPGFTSVAILPNLEVRELSLSDYSGHYVLLLFFPGDFSYVCPMELLAFSDRLDEFTKIGVKVSESNSSIDAHINLVEFSLDHRRFLRLRIHSHGIYDHAA
jgi:alkyl hydroperoxide reductase subunit AhpC